MQHSFETPHPVTLSVEIGRGSVLVEARETNESRVEVSGKGSEEVLVEQRGDQIVVHAPHTRTGLFGGEAAVEVIAVVPTGSRPAVRTGSADIRAQGSWGTARLRSGSGSVEVDSVTGDLVVDTGSGDVEVSEVVGESRIKSGSGDVRVVAAGGGIVVSTGSGDVEIGTAHGPTVVKTGSGDVRLSSADGETSVSTASGDATVERFGRGRFSHKAASGDLAIGIPPEVPVWTDVSTTTGSIRSGLVGAGQPAAGQDHIELRARTVSGDITLRQL